jgi:hypothetical protein
MRAMSVVPTKSEELVHGIHDHLPPLVKTQVTVAPVRNAGTNGRWVFNIPRRGLWHSAQLVVRPIQLSKNLKSDTLDDRQLETASTFVEAVENIELFSKQRFIERLIPETIVSEMLGKSQKLEQWYQFTYADVNPDDDSVANADVAWPDIADVRYVGGLSSQAASEQRCRPHYIIPLPLSSFTSIKKNLQTLFVESLSLVVHTKDFGYFNIAGYDMELRCEFHSFHPNVETVIRNANYKQGIPATLPWHDWIQFDHRLNPLETSFLDYSLESDALISKILVVPQWKNKATNVKTMILSQNLYIVIRSMSEILFEGSVASLRNRYDLCMDETDATQAAETILDNAYAFYIPIHFGLRRDQERFTGGLALSSLTNPRILIYPNEFVYRTGSNGGKLTNQFPKNTNNYDAFDVKVLGKRHFFLRIDSDTGVITRSIES